MIVDIATQIIIVFILHDKDKVTFNLKIFWHRFDSVDLNSNSNKPKSFGSRIQKIDFVFVFVLIMD